MTDPAKSFEIDTRSMRYTADALKAIKSDAVQPVMSIPVSTINTIPDGANGAPLHEQTSIVDSIKAAFGFLAITGKQPLNEFAGCNDRVWSSMVNTITFLLPSFVPPHAKCFVHLASILLRCGVLFLKDLSHVLPTSSPQILPPFYPAVSRQISV